MPGVFHGKITIPAAVYPTTPAFGFIRLAHSRSIMRSATASGTALQLAYILVSPSTRQRDRTRISSVFMISNPSFASVNTRLRSRPLSRAMPIDVYAFRVPAPLSSDRT